jgi:hypothetical protein
MLEAGFLYFETTSDSSEIISPSSTASSSTRSDSGPPLRLAARRWALPLSLFFLARLPKHGALRRRVRRPLLLVFDSIDCSLFCLGTLLELIEEHTNVLQRRFGIRVGRFELSL